MCLGGTQLAGTRAGGALSRLCRDTAPSPGRPPGESPGGSVGLDSTRGTWQTPDHRGGSIAGRSRGRAGEASCRGSAHVHRYTRERASRQVCRAWTRWGQPPTAGERAGALSDHRGPAQRGGDCRPRVDVGLARLCHQCAEGSLVAFASRAGISARVPHRTRLRTPQRRAALHCAAVCETRRSGARDDASAECRLTAADPHRVCGASLVATAGGHSGRTLQGQPAQSHRDSDSRATPASLCADHADSGAVAQADHPTRHAAHARSRADSPFVGLARRPLCCSGSGNSTNCFSITRMVSYDDAVSHMFFGRMIFDNSTPGLAQLGGVWLPLPHLLIALFAWNDYLWTTGLAGSIVGMSCYIATSIYIFLTIRRLVK